MPRPASESPARTTRAPAKSRASPAATSAQAVGGAPRGAGDPARAERVDQVRRFNRLYTRRIGVLEDGYLHSPFSLAEVRVLYELAHHPGATASELARELALDAGYLSRILRKFDGRGLLERQKSALDGRENHLRLTDAGQRTFEPLQASAREQIGALLDQLGEPEQQRLVRAMAHIEQLLETPAAAGSGAPAVTVREVARAGDFGWVVERHGVLYRQEYGWDLTFEALVASIVAKFVDRFDPELERVWIAERDGQRVGCVFLVRASRRVAKLRLFLVEPEARGLGIGHYLVHELLAFARSAGYHTVRLWTQSNLLAARRIYAQVGFNLVESEPNHAFGYDLVSETWELHFYPRARRRRSGAHPRPAVRSRSV
jgi:DNA-binding MarR family transcriptional regulator/N-acetylglutamate synthase-like GNAT family acetyltransferase